MNAQAAAALPIIETDKNYCGTCSPFGFPYGEPGMHCSRCGGPMVITTEQVAATRVMRNRQAQLRQRGGAS